MTDKYDICMRHYDKLAARRRLVYQQVLWGWLSADGANQQLARLMDDEDRLLVARNDRLVLIRPRGGPQRTIYHTLDRSCGYANRNSFEVDLESFARRQGLTACRHCPQVSSAA